MLKKSVSALAACFLLVSASYQVAANQPHWDDGYRIFQDHSPNFIHVEILNVNVTSNKALWFASHSDRVELEARVLKVVRTANNLRPGMIIPILYDRKAAAGGTFAETPSIPEKGQILPAFIKIKGDHFIPAARHHTFSPLAEQQLQQMDRDSVELTEAQIAALQLSEELNGSLQVDTSSELPLEPAVAVEIPKTEPLRAEVVEPTAEVTVASAELPLVDPETPGLITPTIPEVETEMTVSIETPEIETSVSPEPAPTALPVEVATTGVTTDPIENSEQPMIETSSTNTKEVQPRRRTVVVVPPSELRSRRQEEIQNALAQEQARREAETRIEVAEPIPPAPTPVLKAEEVVLPRNPDPQPVEVTVPSESTQPTPPSDPVSVTIAEAEAVAENETPYPVLRAEPVQTAVVESETEVIASPEIPVVTIEPDINEPTMTTPRQPQEEPVTITDFTPPVKDSAPEPLAAATELAQRDRTNMKSYADIYLSIQEASGAAEKQNIAKAIELYQKALLDLQELKQANPDFQPFMVEYRIRDTTRKLEQLRANAPQ